MRPKPLALRVWAPGALGTLLLAGCATSTQSSAPAAAAPPAASSASAVSSALASQAASGAVRALGIDTRHMDRSVRPQDDFYRYVNGNWLKSSPIPADRARYGTFIELADQSELALKAIIEQVAAAAERPPGSDAQKVGDLYRSYMDTERIQAQGLEPVREELRRVASLEGPDALPELLAELMRSGVQVPLGLWVGQDARQSTRYILYASQSGLGLPDRDYYLQQQPRMAEVRAAYLAYMERLLTLAGEKNARGAAQAILQLETALAEKSWDRARSRDREATYNLKSLAELDALTPGFSWTRLLTALGAQRTPGVVVRQPDYFQAAMGLLRKTPAPVLRQYLTFKVLDARAPYLSSDFEEAAFVFHGRTLQGLEQNRPRWKRAVELVDSALGQLVGRMYVERHFSPESKARMQRMVHNLTRAFQQSIQQLEWMGPETKAQAQAKLARFGVKIGYPDKWRDYSRLEVAPADLVGNVRRAHRFELQRRVDKLGQPIDRDEWGLAPQVVNAYYSATLNEIVFPAAILQPPFFDPKADDAVNYGAIGGVIGHEISHGFDDQGSRSDGEGNLRDWWTAEDKAAFQQRTRMLSEQYDGFSPLEGLRVNGKLTLGENIGDLSGLTVAYRAWRLSLEGQQPAVIDGFTGEQRFFMGWAQIWRGLYRDDALRKQLLTDPHSPGQYRVNGVVRNMLEFYQAFGVKQGDGAWLPPDKRVKVW